MYKDFFLFVLALGLFYSPRFFGLDTTLAFPFFGAIIFVGGIRGCRISKSNIQLLKILSVLFLVIFINSLLRIFYIDNASDLSSRLYYPARIFRSIFVLILFIELINIFGPSRIIKIIFYSGIINLLVIFFEIFNIFGSRNFLIELNTYNSWEGEGWESEQGLRSKGFMTGYDQAGIFSLCIGILGFYSGFSMYKKIILYFLVTFVLFYTSRTALYIWLILNALSLLYFLFIQSKKIVIFLVLIFTFFSFLFINSYYDSILLACSYSQPCYKAFELPINYFINSNFSTSSTNDLISNHYIIPSLDFFEAILGIPEKSASLLGNLDSDVGYIQIYYNFGLIFSGIFILFHVKKIISSLSTFATSKYSSLFLIISIILMVSCFKGPYFFSRGIYDVWILSFVLFSNVLIIKRINYAKKF